MGQNVFLTNSVDNAVPLAGGYAEIEVTGTALRVKDQTSDLTVQEGCHFVLCQCSDAQILERLDGTNPTTSIGMPREIDEKWLWSKAELVAARVISSGTAKLRIQQYRWKGR